MSYTPNYTRRNYVNNQAPSINAENLNAIEDTLVALEENAKTDSNKTDALKEDLVSIIDGCSFENINLTKITGKLFNVISKSELTFANGEYAIYELQDTDAAFRVTGNSPSSVNNFPTYCFVDANMEIISKYGIADESLVDYIAFRPTGATKLIIQSAVKNDMPIRTSVCRLNMCIYPSGGDDTAIIKDRLDKYGFAELSNGTFIVNGLIMPEGSLLSGKGRSTVVKTTNSTNCILANARCQIRNLEIVGTRTSASSGEYGDNGIYIYAQDYDTDHKENIRIHNCTIHGFGGSGIHVKNTGLWSQDSVSVSDCEIYHCYSGIKTTMYAEYGRYTNIICRNNNIGCHNCGGNNTFINCTFTDNAIGFFLVGDRNPGHGSCIGCSFNHNNNNTGYAIIMRTNSSGYVFSGCQIWYGNIYIENQCKGVIFNSCEIGRGDGKSFLLTSSNNNGIIAFNSCVFTHQPTINNDGNIKFTASYLFDGTVISS